MLLGYIASNTPIRAAYHERLDGQDYLVKYIHEKHS